MGKFSVIRWGSRTATSIVAAYFIEMAIALSLPTVALANHVKETLSKSSCSAPETYIRTQIAKIVQLRGGGEQTPSGPPATVADFFASFGNKPAPTPASQAAIVDLRQRADAFNAMLKAEGCKPIDIDAQLTKTQAPSEDSRH